MTKPAPIEIERVRIRDRSKWRGMVLIGIGIVVATFTVAEIAVTFRGWGEHGGPYIVMAVIFQSAIAITLISIGLVRRLRQGPSHLAHERGVQMTSPAELPD